MMVGCAITYHDTDLLWLSIDTVYQLTLGLLFSLLQAKARNVEGMRDRMFSGDKINFTEVG